MKSQSGGRRWVAGALSAARAAAFLTLATGVNGTIAALQPRYEPIYVYLAAVVVVAWLGSVLLGVTTAIAAVVLYDTMFAPAQSGPSWSSAVPFVVAIGAAIVTRLARVPLERPRLAPTAPRPLLEAAPAVTPPPLTPTAAVDTSRLDELRAQIAEIRTARDREAGLRAEAAAAARTRIEALQHELRASGERIDELTRRLDQSAQELEAARRRIDEEKVRADSETTRAAALHQQTVEAARRDDEARAQAEAMRRQLRASGVRIDELTKRLDETVQELEVAWRRVDEEKGRSDGEAKRLTELERQANDALQRAVADLARRYQEPLADAKKSLAEAFTRIPLIEKERDDALEVAREADLRQSALQEEVDRVRALLDSETARADQESSLREQAERAGREAVRVVREELEAEADRKIASIAAGLTTDYENALGEATVDREAARAEVRNLTSKVSSLERQLAEERRAALAAREEAGSLREEAAKLKEETTSLREEAVRLKDDAAAEAAARRMQSESQAAALSNQIDRLESELSDLRAKSEAERAEHEKAVAAFEEKIAGTAAGLTSDYEAALGQATIEKEAARTEVRTLTNRVNSLRAELAAARNHAEAERAEHDKVVAEHAKAIAAFDLKIASIVTNITSDHENAIAEAMLEREAARAEARSLTQKLEAVQRKLSDFQAQVERNTSDLRRSVETERQRADSERAAREKSEAEWGEKLQRIVANIAGDHESDLGDALVEREAARAEARELGGRLKTLQQTLDQERARSTPHERTTPQERSTLADTSQRPAVILVVHSDAGMRAMAKHTLEQTGYTVLTAADGLEGLRTASGQRPDVVLTEAVMPKMNGRELVQLLKSKSETAGIRIVLIGGRSGADTATDFRADDYLQTPSDFAAMRATVANVLAK